MKKTLLLTACCCLLILCSCKKGGVNLFVGDYSFKTSGEVAITATTEIDDNNVAIPAALDVSLPTKIGQLSISASDKKNDEVMVVINYLDGDVIVTTGFCDGNTIELDSFDRDILPISVSSLFTNDYSIKVGGKGQMYDENMIVFDITCKGKGEIGSVKYKIKEKDIKMVAYRN